MKQFTRLIIERNNRFLFLKEKGFWNFPGGKIEKNESAENSALRELKEETNLSSYNLFLFLEDDFDFSGDKWKGFYYFCKVSDFSKLKIMEPEKCESLEFFDINSIEKLPNRVPKKIIKELQKDLNLFH